MHIHSSNTHNCCSDDVPQAPQQPSTFEWRPYIKLLIAAAMLFGALILEFGFDISPAFPFDLAIYSVAYLLAGFDVLKLAFRKAIRGDFFNEFVLMSVATLGAFSIGEYSEGVAVMVFYSIGEWFQEAAVKRAKANIKALLDIRPDQVTVVREGRQELAHPSAVSLGEVISVKPGERVALDGTLLSDQASFDTSALTGESKPDTIYYGREVLAGMINLNTPSDIRVEKLFRDSKLSRILQLVQDATARKSRTQLFIARFAKVYTPIVFFLALALLVLPYFIVEDYVFRDWLYRSLVFLVISCPCALVVSIPLGYFGGIGLASRNGILFKGGNFLDVMTNVDTVVLDKTGTLTRGVFNVREVETGGVLEADLLLAAAALERNSTHPVAQAIVRYAGSQHQQPMTTDVEEISGHGLKGRVDGREVMVGNAKLLKRHGVPYPEHLDRVSDTIVLVAIEGIYAGAIIIGDELKDDSLEAITALRRMGIRTVMLSGDKQTVVDQVAGSLGIDTAFGDLLPEDKLDKVRAMKNENRRVAFVGDGVNDAPVIAFADVGIAMGGLGSDAAIETADVVIQNDQPVKVVSAIKAGRVTRNIVWQNISLAMVVKVLVLALGAGGVASLWEAVIADVGVALIAILNAVRVQQMKI